LCDLVGGNIWLITYGNILLITYGNIWLITYDNIWLITVSCGRGHCNAGGCCLEGDERPRGVVMNGEFCSPSIVHQIDTPESVLWVVPPSEDGLSV